MSETNWQERAEKAEALLESSDILFGCGWREAVEAVNLQKGDPRNAAVAQCIKLAGDVAELKEELTLVQAQAAALSSKLQSHYTHQSDGIAAVREALRLSQDLPLTAS